MLQEQNKDDISGILAGSAKLAREGFFKNLLLYEDTFLGVINEQRQFILVNQAFLLEHRQASGGQSLSLRPGDVLSCRNALHSNLGCGTHNACHECSLYKLILKTKNTKEALEAPVTLTVNFGGREIQETYQARIEPKALDDAWVYLVYLFLH